MPALNSYDYAYIRVVPRQDRGEFINVGVIVFCRTKNFLAARLAIDEQRLRLLDTGLDLAQVRAHLDLIPRICDGHGPIGQLGQADAFHWLVAPHNTVIQTSAVHLGLCVDPETALDTLVTNLADA